MAKNPDVTEPTAADIMTADVIIISADATIDELAKLMAKHRISGIPVTDEQNRVVGMVTEGDVVELDADVHFPHSISLFDSVIFLGSMKKFEDRLRHVVAATVRDIMSTDVISVSKDATLRQIATLMADKQVNRLPVIDGGRLVGIVTRADVVRAMARS